MDFGYSPRTRELQGRVSDFMRAHVYPADAAAAHYRVLAVNDDDDVSKQVEALAAAGLRFPKATEGEGGAKSPPPARAYAAASLKGLGDAELMTYMGKGKSADDFRWANAPRALSRSAAACALS